jgi:hypothetical protein
VSVSGRVFTISRGVLESAENQFSVFSFQLSRLAEPTASGDPTRLKN